MMALRAGLFALIAASIGASSALAQTAALPAPPSADPTKKAKDPNEIVCEKQQEPGSRLASAKVCHTRAEWADLRHQDRQMIDKAQTQIGAMGK